MWAALACAASAFATTRAGAEALLVIEAVHDDADGEAEETVDLAHPLGVALGQIVVDGDNVDTPP